MKACKEKIVEKEANTQEGRKRTEEDSKRLEDEVVIEKNNNTVQTHKEGAITYELP